MISEQTKEITESIKNSLKGATKREKELIVLISQFELLRIQEWQDDTKEVLKFFKCKKCSHCCEIPVFVSPNDLIIIGLFLKYNLRKKKNYVAFLNKYTTLISQGKPYLKTPCPFIKRSLCSIYKVRPPVCRSFPFSGDGFYLNNINSCPLSKEIVEKFQAFSEEWDNDIQNALKPSQLEWKINQYKRELQETEWGKKYAIGEKESEDADDFLQSQRNTRDKILKEFQPEAVQSKHFNEMEQGAFINPRLVKLFIQYLKRR